MAEKKPTQTCVKCLRQPGEKHDDGTPVKFYASDSRNRNICRRCKIIYINKKTKENRFFKNCATPGRKAKPSGLTILE